MLRSCSLHSEGSWENHFALMEFLYNNSYHASNGMVPYMALSQSCKMKFADIKRMSFEFQDGDFVFLRVAAREGL